MKPLISIQGHRGARGLFPENTLAGFTGAISLGVDTVELDVALTKDGVAVVSHEPRLNPDITRDARGAWLNDSGPPIGSLSFAELRRYDVGRIKPGTAYAAAFPKQQPQDGARIPALADVFALDWRVRFAVELKTFPGAPALTAAPEEMVDRVLAIAKSAQVMERLVVQSFDWRALRYLRRIRPDVSIGWLTKAQPEHERRLWWNGVAAADFGGSVPRAVAAESARFWIAQCEELNEGIVDAAHLLGMKVIPWDIAPEADLTRLFAMPVDGLITDRPDIALASIRGAAATPP